MKNFLFILPFDHRTSFQKMIFGHKNPLTDQERQIIRKYKKIIFEAVKKVGQEQGYDDLAILVDEEFGAEIHRQAKKIGLRNAFSMEKSGQDIFDFEYKDWQSHLLDFQPTFAKALVRVEIGQDNSVQNARLKELNDFCQEKNFKFLLEPLIQPSQKDLEQAGGDKKRFDFELRTERFVEAVAEFHAAGVKPDIWKIEGTETKEEMDACSQAVFQGGKPNPQIVVLGRGESKERVEHWLKMGAKSKGAIGFAIGRTIFSEPITKFHQAEISEEETINKIAKNYSHFIDVFKKAI